MMKKYRVGGTWSRTYFAKDKSQANEFAQKDLKSINNQNIEFNVQFIDSLEEKKDYVTENKLKKKKDEIIGELLDIFDQSDHNKQAFDLLVIAEDIKKGFYDDKILQYQGPTKSFVEDLRE